MECDVLKPTPISDEQFECLIKNANQDAVNRFMFVKDIVIDDIKMEYDDGSTIRFSQLSVDEKDDLLVGGPVDGFEIQPVAESCMLFRKVNLVWLNDAFFELLESVKSGNSFKIRDREGNIFDYELKTKGVKKIKAQQNKIRYSKPPKTEGGMDALNNLYK